MQPSPTATLPAPSTGWGQRPSQGGSYLLFFITMNVTLFLKRVLIRGRKASAQGLWSLLRLELRGGPWRQPDPWAEQDQVSRQGRHRVSRVTCVTCVRDGLLVASVDLNMCRQIKDKWCFRVRSLFNFRILLLTILFGFRWHRDWICMQRASQRPLNLATNRILYNKKYKSSKTCSSLVTLSLNKHLKELSEAAQVEHQPTNFESKLGNWASICLSLSFRNLVSADKIITSFKIPLVKTMCYSVTPLGCPINVTKYFLVQCFGIVFEKHMCKV